MYCVKQCAYSMIMSQLYHVTVTMCAMKCALLKQPASSYIM